MRGERKIIKLTVMDAAQRTSPRPILSKVSSHPHLMNSSSSAVLGTEAHYFAYKLGYISRFKIEEEAKKAEPRLHKLVGHCSLFDQARRYILDHNSQEDIVDAESVGELSLDDSDEEFESEFEHLESTDIAALSRKHSDKLGGVVVVQATEIPNTYLDDDLDSDSTETDDDDDGWSDSTCDDDNGDAYSDYKIMQIHHTTKSKYLHRDDDFLLWSQQPQVLSQSEANGLLIEAFA
ncbi:hypothetical protein LTS07_002150 [Exophiala sideris]|nr:hypothetical protein LTS07_002150 [Exophiala sideris]KAK5041745.1 hypothetical protein LTR13_002412 [Exophiala sideris]KAK5184865.1 hypothetical protein LTR44_002711 [Eurotiomycetes sp. CCFEE 6388]